MRCDVRVVDVTRAETRWRMEPFSRWRLFVGCSEASLKIMI